jgi:hypothetical protein
MKHNVFGNVMLCNLATTQKAVAPHSFKVLVTYPANSGAEPGPAANHLRPSSAKFKTVWRCTSPCSSIECCLIKHTGTCTFTFFITLS